MTSNIKIRNKEIIEKSNAGKTHEELCIEYNISLSNINRMVEKYIEFKSYCNEMETYIAENQINQEVKTYNLAKLLKFHSRSIHSLIYKNIMSIEKLITIEKEEICFIRRIGKATAQHIIECIDDYDDDSSELLKPYVTDAIILENFNSNIDVSRLRKKFIENNETDDYFCIPCINNQPPSPQVIKGNREYIRKLIDLVDENQFTFSFLKKEINKEFDKLEKSNEQLIEMLKNK